MKVSQSAVLASLLVAVNSLALPTIGRPVWTTSGLLHGHAAKNRTQVSEYLGIPFAKPPVNDLRFAAPEPYFSNAAFNASSFGLTCMMASGPVNFTALTEQGFHMAPTAEEFMNINSGVGLELGEDCLTVNVWTKPQTGDRAKAVILFLYGGGFQSGYSNASLGTGEIFADEDDVVVITANYRTNVFGFPGLQPEVSGMAANPGLLDQRLVVEWARDNVAGFGGDPSRITLYGQSAGSVSVNMYGYAYAHDPIVHGLISGSGTTDNFGASPPNATAGFQYLSGLLGCDNSSSSTAALQKSVACVRSKPSAQVLAASLEVPIKHSSFGAFSPTVDGVTVFGNYTERNAERAFAQVPRLMGNNAQEGLYYKLLFALQGFNFPEIFWEFGTLVIFTCPTQTAATGFAAHSSQKVWRYMYNGDYPNVGLTVDPSTRAFHGAEQRPLFGFGAGLGIPDTPAEQGTGRLMRAAWSAFARNPTTALEAEPFCWPAYSSHGGSASIVELGIGNTTSASFHTSAGSSDDLCPQLMPRFEAIGGANAILLEWAILATPQLQQYKGNNVSEILDILVGVAEAVTGSQQ